jgi:hypothetical protein
MTAPEVEFGLPHDGVRVRVSARGRFWTLSWLAIVAGTSMSAIFAAGTSGGVPGLAIAAIGLAVFVWLFGGIWRTRLASRELVVDRIGIHDSSAGVPPIPWSAIAALDESPAINGGMWYASGGYLSARLTLEAWAARAGGLRLLYEWALAQELREGLRLPATESLDLPIPFEYLVLLIRERGGPIRPHSPNFDPFEYDARWRPPAEAAKLIEIRLGARAALRKSQSGYRPQPQQRGRRGALGRRPRRVATAVRLGYGGRPAGLTRAPRPD